MEAEHYNFSVDENQENSLKDLLIKYLYNWKWFLLSVVLSLVMGFVYLRYQAPVYEVTATILIKDDKNGTSTTDELSAFQDLGIFKSGNNIDNEIEILKSRSLMTKVVKELKLNVSYFSFGRPIEHERYYDTPITLNYTVTDSLKEIAGTWLVIPQSSKKFTLKNGTTNEIMGDFKFGDEVKVPFGKLVFTATEAFYDMYLNKNFRVTLSSVDEIVNKYLGEITINPVNKNSNAIVIALKDPLPDKAAAIVNNLIKQHNLDAISDKNEVSKNTANFINDRIRFITEELSEVEGEAEGYKTKHKLVDAESEVKQFLQTGSQSEMGLLDATTQLRVAEFMNEYIQKHNKPTDLIPANLGLSEPSIALQISECNKLVIERNRLIKNSSEKNPVVENIDSQILGLRNAIKESLINIQSTLQIKAKEIAKKETEINAKIGAVPKYEREYRTIQRQQQIKEALYLYLLQKREETNIALAVTVANAKVIDSAYSNGDMVAPKKNIIYLSAFLLGLVIPILVLYVLELLDTKLHGKNDIDKLKIPFLGDIPLSRVNERLVVIQDTQSNVAEAFRLLRTNVEFINSNRKEKSKTVFITSTIGREGKSYIAINLAASFALSGKKTLLIGTDLRSPKILTYLGLADKIGLTNFIVEEKRALKDVIFNMPNVPNCDVLPSGPIPPNPAELLMNDKVKDLFETVKLNYDYIIVDTAPVGLVTDTLLISSYADSTIFVARANYLDKRLLRIAETLNKEKRLPNMAVLINGSDYKRGYGYGYGYGYGGYGYGKEKIEPKWKNLFSKKIA